MNGIVNRVVSVVGWGGVGNENEKRRQLQSKLKIDIECHVTIRTHQSMEKSINRSVYGFMEF